MARVAITEFAAKKLLLGDTYPGISVTNSTYANEIAQLSYTHLFVVKVDTGIKKRGKAGLVTTNVARDTIQSVVAEFFNKGYERCLIEPHIPHEASEEKYLSLTLERTGVRIFYSNKGGVNIESNKDSLQDRLISYTEISKTNFNGLSIKGINLQNLFLKMKKNHISFLEINPYIVQNNTCMALDLAVEIDSAKERSFPEWFQKNHIVSNQSNYPEEQQVLDLDARSQASFNLKILNPNGSILTLLSGGGASLVTFDTLVAHSLQGEIINYCEYSGAPTREETESFSNILFSVLKKSSKEKKVILIAGGVSNFTNVLLTFEGVVDAIKHNLDSLKDHHVSFIVRRGGLLQEEGLLYLKNFLLDNKLPCEVYGPELSLGELGTLVKKYL